MLVCVFLYVLMTICFGRDVKEDNRIEEAPNNLEGEVGGVSTPRITFADVEPRPSKSRALYVPGPRERDRGKPVCIKTDTSP